MSNLKDYKLVPTEEEVRKYISETLCDLACPWASFLCYDGGACEILERYKRGELSFRKNEKGEIKRLF